MTEINLQYYSQLKDRINGCSSCEALRSISAEALGAIAKQQAAIQEQIAALQPILALLEAPTSLTAVITWIGNFINGFLRPIVKPYQTYLVQLTMLAAELTEITDAIRNASLKFPDCNIH